jgi:hypothetical protein
MAESDRVKYLRIALLVVGVIFIVGIYPLTASGRPVGLGTRDNRNTSR